MKYKIHFDVMHPYRQIGWKMLTEEQVNLMALGDVVRFSDIPELYRIRSFAFNPPFEEGRITLESLTVKPKFNITLDGRDVENG